MEGRTRRKDKGVGGKDLKKGQGGGSSKEGKGPRDWVGDWIPVNEWYFSFITVVIVQLKSQLC